MARKKRKLILAKNAKKATEVRQAFCRVASCVCEV
ncbi:hypothetical protein GBAR_LOCUS18863 [Geodia barretti]|uniref:Uncharacterized protein n=1 Tax=Geodia barretti TaxID=519541 RepID=A0AA35SRM2_GEOBA|nr:hypothetical protein GBAR_LOCUS18863 [Geodia barretti]